MFIRICVLSWLLMFCPCFLCAQGQENVLAERDGSGWVIECGMRGSGLSTSKSPYELRLLELNAMAGYMFNKRLAVYLPLTLTAGMFESKKEKSYEAPGQIGLGIGYNMINDRAHRLELVSAVGPSLDDKWGFVYYDCGLRYVFPSNIFLGAGVKYFSTYKGEVGDHCNFYGMVGFKILRVKK